MRWVVQYSTAPSMIQFKKNKNLIFKSNFKNRKYINTTNKWWKFSLKKPWSQLHNLWAIMKWWWEGGLSEIRQTVVMPDLGENNSSHTVNRGSWWHLWCMCKSSSGSVHLVHLFALTDKTAHKQTQNSGYAKSIPSYINFIVTNLHFQHRCCRRTDYISVPKSAAALTFIL